MMSTNHITQTPYEIAVLVLATMARSGGELWLFSFEPQELADAIEVHPEIATKLQIMARRSKAMALLLSGAKAILDIRAASQAVDELLRQKRDNTTLVTAKGKFFGSQDWRSCL